MGVGDVYKRQVQGKGLEKILQWKIEIFYENITLLFPRIASPVKFVPKNSDVTTLLRISHIWNSPNQQWKIVVKVAQCIVKTPTPKDLPKDLPKPKVSKCQISLTDQDWKIINNKS